MIWMLLIVFLAASLALGWRESFILPRARRTALLALRLGAVIILGLLVSDLFPRWFRARGKPDLLVLVDASRSMTMNDGRPQNRWRRALDAVSSLRKEYRKITVLRTSGNGLSDQMTDSLSQPLDFTDLSQAVAHAIRNKPGAILLLSDGNHNRGSDPVRSAASGIPLYSVGFGPVVRSASAGIADLWSSGEVEAGQPAEINLSLKGGPVRRLSASLWEKSLKLAEKRFDLNGDTVLSFRVIPRSDGLHRYTTVLEDSEGEILDQSAAVLSVVKRSFRLLFITETPGWDLRFWQQAVGQDPSYSLDLLAKQGKGWRKTFSRGADAMGGFDSLDQYDAIILGPLNSGDVPVAAEQRIAELVRQKGTGLILLGSFNRNWITGRLAPIVQGRGIKPTTGNPRPEPELFSTGMLEAAKEQSFEKLPPLVLDHDLGIRDKEVLPLASLQGPDRKIYPLWARVAEGQGRMAQIAAEDLWRWKLAAAGAGRDTALFGEIVQSSLKWVLRREGSAIEAGPDRTLNLQDQDVRFTGRWGRMPAGQGHNVSWSVAIKGDRGYMRTQELADWGGGSFVAELGPLSAGQYSYLTWLELGGKRIYSSRGRFYVEPDRAELRGHQQNAGLLRTLASASGGRYWDEKELPAAAWHKEIKVPASPNPYGQEPAAGILTVCLLLAAEWFLRRKWGQA